MTRKLLVAAGTSDYPNLPKQDQRREIAGVLNSIADFFTGLNYERELKDISNNPTSSDLRGPLGQWFGAKDRDSTDWIVFYYTGHGEVIGTKTLYLLTSDFSPGNYGSAFSLAQLGDFIVAPRADGNSRPIKKLLVIIDTCFAGEGTLQLAETLSQLFRMATGSMFYLLGAALPREEAQAGALAEALIEAVNELSLRYVQQEFLFFDQVIPAINRRLRSHQVVFSPVLSPLEEPQFFPNRNYIAGLDCPVNANDAQRAISDLEFRAHWSPRARGVEFDSQPGEYFCGRSAILDELISFFNNKEDNTTRVITGQPGSGKSAILSQIVVASMPKNHERISNGSGRDVPSLDLAIHAKGKRLSDIVERFASALEVEPDINRVFDVLKARDLPMRVVVDALDEAKEPALIAKDVLRPLSTMKRVKLLVGTRKEYSKGVGESDNIIDIDEDDNTKTDIIRYVEMRLLNVDDLETPSPYAGSLKLVHRIAAAVAESAYPNFLIARLVVEDLLARPALIDPDAETASAFPSTVGQAFAAYLHRFGPNESTVKDLFLPLAYAEGEGLPWDNIWAAMASSLSDQRYTDIDVRWLLQNAGSFILETTENGRSVYRLYHQALVDYLRRGRSSRNVQSKFVSTLKESIPGRMDATTPDWGLANRYILTHLATHAAAAGMLDELVADPLFLVYASRSRLLRLLPGVNSAEAREAARAYQLAAHNLDPLEPSLSASYLEMAARQHAADVFASLITQLPLTRHWSVPWAHWQVAGTHRILGHHQGGVNAAAAIEFDGQQVIISGGSDGTVRVWNLADGSPCYASLTSHQGRVRALTAIEFDGEAVIISGGGDGTVRVWNLADGSAFYGPLIGHEGGVNAVAAIDLDGHPVIISGGDEGTVRVRNLEDGSARYAPLTGHEGWVGAVAAIELDGQPVIISGGEDGTVRVWNLSDGSACYAPLTGHRGGVWPLAATELDGQPVIISGGEDGTVRVWNLADSSARYAPLSNHESEVRALAATELDGDPVIISGSSDGTVRVWSLADGSARYAPLTGHKGGVNSVAAIELNDQPVIISGGEDGTVRVWNVADGCARYAPLSGHEGWVRAVTATELDGQPVIVSGGDEGTVRVWNVADGSACYAPLSGHQGGVLALAATELDGQPVIISGGSYGTLGVWNLADGSARYAPLTGHEGLVRALAATELDGQPVIISGGSYGTMRVWNLADGRLLATIEFGSMILALGVGPPANTIVGAKGGLMVVRLNELLSF